MSPWLLWAHFAALPLLLSFSQPPRLCCTCSYTGQLLFMNMLEFCHDYRSNIRYQSAGWSTIEQYRDSVLDRSIKSQNRLKSLQLAGRGFGWRDHEYVEFLQESARIIHQSINIDRFCQFTSEPLPVQGTRRWKLVWSGVVLFANHFHFPFSVSFAKFWTLYTSVFIR